MRTGVLVSSSPCWQPSPLPRPRDMPRSALCSAAAIARRASTTFRKSLISYAACRREGLGAERASPIVWDGGDNRPAPNAAGVVYDSMACRARMVSLWRSHGTDGRDEHGPLATSAPRGGHRPGHWQNGPGPKHDGATRASSRGVREPRPRLRGHGPPRPVAWIVQQGAAWRSCLAPVGLPRAPCTPWPSRGRRPDARGVHGVPHPGLTLQAREAGRGLVARGHASVAFQVAPMVQARWPVATAPALISPRVPWRRASCARRARRPGWAGVGGA